MQKHSFPALRPNRLYPVVQNSIKSNQFNGSKTEPKVKDVLLRKFYDFNMDITKCSLVILTLVTVRLLVPRWMYYKS